jgi:ribosomal-protein-alanine N-acetyltransferase
MPKISTPHLLLTTPSEEDLAALVNFENRNRDHLAKWETPVFSLLNESTTLEEVLRKRLETWIKECREGKSVRFILRPIASPDQIIGFCNFTQIFHGAFQACYLGYKIDYAYEGKGLMFEALKSCISYVFEDLHLHRIMANYMPENIKSAKLLSRLGFEIEGHAKNYLLINNRWEDHVLTALSVERWEKLSPKSC